MNDEEWREAAHEWDDMPTVREVTPSMSSLLEDLPRLIREREERVAAYDRR